MSCSRVSIRRLVRRPGMEHPGERSVHSINPGSRDWKFPLIHLLGVM